MTWMAYVTFQPKSTPFKTPAMTTSAKHQKLTPFKTLVFYIENWLLSRPLHFTSELTPFKNLTVVGHKEAEQTPPAVNCPKCSPIQSFQDPQIGFIQCFNLHGRLPSGTFIKPSTRWILDFFGKIKSKTHRMQLVNSSQATSLTCPAFSTAAFTKMHSFQDPKNFTHIIDSNNRVQTLSHRLRHRTRTS